MVFYFIANFFLLFVRSFEPVREESFIWNQLAIFELLELSLLVEFELVIPIKPFSLKLESLVELVNLEPNYMVYLLSKDFTSVTQMLSLEFDLPKPASNS